MADTSGAGGSQEVSLSKRFASCEAVIQKLEDGTSSSKDMQDQLKECEEELKEITKEISVLSLFSKNETITDLPTSSLQFFLVPVMLATVTQNIIQAPEERLASLDRAKIYLRDFLERLVSYEIIDISLPWQADTIDGSENEHEEANASHRRNYDPARKRNEKVRRFQQQKELEKNYEALKEERLRRSDDDSVLRELLLVRIRLAANKAVDDLEQIEEERPLAERMLLIAKGEVKPAPKKAPPPSQKPFILTRDKLEKEVFGLGYPSIPTKTVDEWCDDMVKEGIWENSKSSKKLKASDDEDESEEAEEKRRLRSQKWDEYKDTHRRGWGNTKNKG
uniref:Immunoglobulin-binding protein 1 n=1 Tax=Syphacia muris TaxID=451379 RepID=A0A0N5AZ15_9BILA